MVRFWKYSKCRAPKISWEIGCRMWVEDRSQGLAWAAEMTEITLTQTEKTQGETVFRNLLHIILNPFSLTIVQVLLQWSILCRHQSEDHLSRALFYPASSFPPFLPLMWDTAETSPPYTRAVGSMRCFWPMADRSQWINAFSLFFTLVENSETRFIRILRKFHSINQHGIC